MSRAASYLNLRRNRNFHVRPHRSWVFFAGYREVRLQITAIEAAGGVIHIRDAQGIRTFTPGD